MNCGEKHFNEVNSFHVNYDWRFFTNGLMVTVTKVLPYRESLSFIICLLMFFNFETAMEYNIAITYTCRTKIESRLRVVNFFSSLTVRKVKVFCPSLFFTLSK